MPLGKIYSTHFFNKRVTSVATSNTAWYLVPAGKVAVVRSIDMLVIALGRVIVGRVNGDTWIASSAAVPAWQVYHWTGDQVMNAGEKFGTQWIDGDVTVTVSGFLLSTT